MNSHEFNEDPIIIHQEGGRGKLKIMLSVGGLRAERRSTRKKNGERGFRF